MGNLPYVVFIFEDYMKVFEKKIGEIVDENYIYARALHYLGLEFYNYEDRKLIDLCEERGIDRKRVIKSFYQFDSSTRIPLDEIKTYPLELTLEFLRYSHNSYIKNYLPYVANLINQLDGRSTLIRDLKMVFPLFVEDFINHIYKEEDELFDYVEFLIDVHQKNPDKNPSRIWKYSSLSLEQLRALHVDEDEMAGLRELIDEIPVDNLLTDVIVKEIQAFNREILFHSEIENEILFPKAIELECLFYQSMESLCRLN